MSLTFHRVHILRTVPELDTLYARRWNLSVGTIRDARVGITWADHPTPPLTAPRAHKGTWHGC
jgi:hypothetical protein